MAKKRPAVKCTKTKRDGSPCGGYAVQGGALCRNHMRRSPAASAVVQEKLVEAKAEAIAESRVRKTIGQTHEELRMRSLVKSIAKMQILTDVYYDLAKAGDMSMAQLHGAYQRELTSLLKIPTPEHLRREELNIKSVDETVERIVQIIDGSMAPEELKRVEGVPVAEFTEKDRLP